MQPKRHLIKGTALAAAAATALLVGGLTSAQASKYAGTLVLLANSTVYCADACVFEGHPVTPSWDEYVSREDDSVIGNGCYLEIQNFPWPDGTVSIRVLERFTIDDEKMSGTWYTQSSHNIYVYQDNRKTYELDLVPATLPKC